MLPVTKKMKDIEKKLVRMMRDRIRINEPMSRHTSIGTGGKVRWLATPSTSKEIIRLVRLARDNHLDFLVIGRGTNLLVRDGGYNGLVIKLAGNFANVRFNIRTVYAESGASYSLLARRLVEKKRTGLEFAVGIPGSVGGAVRMNASAWGGETSKALLRIRYIDSSGHVKILASRDLDSGYRHTGLARDAIILSATFDCPPGKLDRAMLKRSLKRKDKQPLEHRSFGSTFINPANDHAGRMIEACGLKGTCRGGAMISQKHANFILNVSENTTVRDVEFLIRLMKTEVRKKFGVVLKPEVIIVGNN
jgi:UDP-N-acetylmuramate dehydrogenase